MIDEKDRVMNKVIRSISSLTLTAVWLSVSQFSYSDEAITPFTIFDDELVNKYQTLHKDAYTGANFDPATGSVTFEATDISLPGNFGIPVELTRWIPSDDMSTGGPEGWEWNIPFIRGKLMASTSNQYSMGTANFEPSGWRSGEHCTNSETVGVVVISNRERSHGFEPWDYWDGMLLHIPGKVSEKILVPPQGSPHRYVTKSNYVVTNCITDNANGQEGFEVLGPDGTKYTFNSFRRYDSGTKAQDRRWVPARVHTKLILISEIEDRFGNSIEYHYTDNADLDYILASDGRRIDIDYEEFTARDMFGQENTRYRARYAHANGKTWEYQYPPDTSPGVKKLSKVYLPDGRYWSYSSGVYRDAFNPDANAQFVPSEQMGSHRGEFNCQVSASHQGTYTASVRSPSKLEVDYEFKYTYQGRSNVVPSSRTRLYASPTLGAVYSVSSARNLNCGISLSVTKKTVSGPGLEDQEWTYSYSQNTGTYVSGTSYNDYLTGPFDLAGTSLPSVVSSAKSDYRTVTEIAPDFKNIHYVDRRFQSPTEGMVMIEDTVSKSGSLKQRVENEYDQSNYVGNNWLHVLLDNYPGGNYPPSRLSVNEESTEHFVNPVKRIQRVYNIQGTDVYTTQKSDYDQYGFFGTLEEYNNFSSVKRYTQYTYHHRDQDEWVLGLPDQTKLSSNGTAYTTVSDIQYHGINNSEYPGWYLPSERRSYGTWVLRFPEYHSAEGYAGALKRLEWNANLRNADGTSGSGNRYQIHDIYNGGLAQHIVVPSRYTPSGALSMYRNVNDEGQVTSHTDLNGVTADYGYDDSGLLQSVDLPSPWADLWVEWDFSASNAISRTANRCILNASSSACSGPVLKQQYSELDALYRVTLNGERGVTISGDGRYVSSRYDVRGFKLFESHASNSTTEAEGTGKTYDALGRLLTTTLNNGGQVSHRYLSGNRVETNDAEGNVSTVRYLAYGLAEKKQPVQIDSPEGITTTLQVNIFGDIEQVTQAGPGKDGLGTVSLTEYRAYDSLHHLCKVSRADTGTILYSNNVLGNVVKKSSGVSRGSVTSCSAGGSVPVSQETTFLYDNLGKLWKISYGDNSPDIEYLRDRNGNVETQTVGAEVVQSYSHNALGLVEYEQVSVGSKTFRLDYLYDSLGSSKELWYPDGDRITYAPNAFGEPTEVKRRSHAGRSAFTYADGITYHPNGELASFDYGNGLSHSQTLDSMQRPDRVRDYRTGLTALDLDYGYDANSNIVSIIDSVESQYSLTSLSYDGLDRLLSTDGGPGIGDSLLRYDGLGNITRYESKDSVLDYVYSSTGRLDSVNGTGSDSKSYSAFSYDSRGNVTNNGHGSFVYNLAGHMTLAGSDNTYWYDGHNRRVKTVRGEHTDYSVYSHDGKLYYLERAGGGVNHIYLGKKLIAKDGFIPEIKPKQHFKPFGESLEGEIDAVGFTGHKFDTDTRLSYMQARYYDPVIGRFYSNDPVGFRGVHSFNRYAYANNNPYKYTDPDGRSPVSNYHQGMRDTAGFLSGDVTQADFNQRAEAFGEMTGVSDAIDSIQSVLNGDLSGAAMSAVALVCKVCKVTKGLTTPKKYFGSKTKQEVKDALEKKYGPPKSSREHADTYYNDKTKRSYNVHEEPGHNDGKPHVDIRRRGGYEERKYDLKEGEL